MMVHWIIKCLNLAMMETFHHRDFDVFMIGIPMVSKSIGLDTAVVAVVASDPINHFENLNRNEVSGW